MSSCVMIVSELSNRIEAIFSYKTPVEVCTFVLFQKKKKQYCLLLNKQQLSNKWAWKSQNIKQQRASNEK